MTEARSVFEFEKFRRRLNGNENRDDSDRSYVRNFNPMTNLLDGSARGHLRTENSRLHAAVRP